MKKHYMRIIFVCFYMSLFVYLSYYVSLMHTELKQNKINPRYDIIHLTCGYLDLNVFVVDYEGLGDYYNVISTQTNIVALYKAQYEELEDCK